VLTYNKGGILEVAHAVVSDQQCAPGLHVLPLNHKPEWYGLCEANHELIALTVEVDSADICYAGIGPSVGKVRVKKLKVLD
jgi:hypothetical protein